MLNDADTLNLESKIFYQERKIKIFLPKGYDNYRNTDKKYMTAWLFDAQSEGFLNFYKATISHLIEEGHLDPLILVGIPSVNRQYEFTPKARGIEGLKVFQKSGGADLLALHIQNEILPILQNKYRCNTYNIGIGHSLGATFVTYSMIKYPRLFNAAISISPNFEYDNEQIIHRLDNLKHTQIFKHKFLYIAYGFGDNYEERFKIGIEKFGSLIVKKNIPGLRWQIKSMDNDNHGMTAMEGIFKGLYALSQQFTLPATKVNAFYNDTSKSFIDNVKDHFKLASEWSSLKLPTVDNLNNIGYNCYYAGKINEAIQLFHWGLLLYPDNINLYDSMGEMQENNGDKKSALKFYSKGLNVVKKQIARLEHKSYNNLISNFKKRIKSLENSK